MNLCPPCRVTYDGWLDYRKPVTGWVVLNDPARSAENKAALIQDQRELVKRQLALVATGCTPDHHKSPHLEEVTP